MTWSVFLSTISAPASITTEDVQPEADTEVEISSGLLHFRQLSSFVRVCYK